MNILWVSSSPIGPVSRILDLPYKGSSGTWIQTEYESIAKAKDVKMFFLCPIPNIPEGKVCKQETDEGIAFGVGYKPSISFGKPLPKRVTNEVSEIIQNINPDIIHIWGTESSFTASIASLPILIPKVIFIQGLIGMHRRYMGTKYVRDFNKYSKNTLLEKLKRAIKHRYYNRQIPLEQAAISSANNIITDNSFTKAYCESFAQPRFFHHFLYPNSIFYQKQWDYADTERFSIFTIFSADPSKGLSQLLKAVNIVKRSIPEVKLYIPGPFNLDKNNRIDIKRCSPFERWIYRYISANKLWDNVVFTGKLNPDQMQKHYLSSNVFVSPSCMEVHSSSVREAMAVGVPTISSFCGSVNEYIEHGKSGLIYRFEEEEVLARHLQEILRNPEYAIELGAQAHKRMSKPTDQTESLYKIYQEIIDSQNQDKQ